MRRRYGVIDAMLHIYGSSPRLKEELLNAFTFENPAWAQAARFSPWGPPKAIPKYIMLARETAHCVSIPRGVQPHAQLTAKAQIEFMAINWINRTRSCPVEFPPLKLTLGKEQAALCHAFKLAVKRHKNPFGTYLFIAPTAVGKTIGQAAIAAASGQRVLILCLTNLIKKAWEADLEKAYGITKKQLGLIQTSTWRIGEHFTLASVQTLARRKDRWDELKELIGCVVVDEVDTIRAPSIYEFVMGFPAKFVIGATATRTGRHYNHYLQSIFGSPVKTIIGSNKDTNSSMAVQDALVVYTDFNYAYTPLELNYHDLTEAMSEDEERNTLIVHHVRQDIKNKLFPLIVTKRVPHVHTLVAMLKEVGIKAVALTGETNAHRAETDRTLKKIFEHTTIQCVVATSAAIMRGANINPLDILHVTMPENKTNMEQLTGRIRRRYQGKTKCLIRMYVDKNVPYLFGKYKREIVPAFRTLKIPRYVNMFIA